MSELASESSTQRPREAPIERQRGSAMSELASESSTQRPREAPIERQRGSAMSELASESSTQRPREAPTERQRGSAMSDHDGVTSRGELRSYHGMAPGAGQTFAMVGEAR